ncbi:unnamed protein product [Peniophora sp. CBMAI 1063]|nr:unnamed protein product [Peniophora sp. CBMAI 1063]
MSNTGDSGKKWALQCTGVALETVNKHSSDEEITLFASAYCPFVQRAWSAIEFLEVPYRYYEVDAYAKPKPAELLEVSPKGLVPGLKLKNNGSPLGLNESTVLVEYFETVAEQTTKKTLLPPVTEPYARALVRLQCDHVSRSLVPNFYRYLQAQDLDAQIQGYKDFLESIAALLDLQERFEKEVPNVPKTGGGLYREGGEMNLLDVYVAPWLYRAKLVLAYYRGFEMPKGKKFSAWVDRLFAHPAFANTCSTDDVYIDSYERYAYNRPNNSQMADAINSGRALP